MIFVNNLVLAKNTKTVIFNKQMSKKYIKISYLYFSLIFFLDINILLHKRSKKCKNNVDNENYYFFFVVDTLRISIFVIPYTIEIMDTPNKFQK